MSGRASNRVFSGATARGIATHVRQVLALHALPAQAVATCPRCQGPLRFSSEALTGRTLEQCDGCGHSAAVIRRSAEDAAAQSLPLTPQSRQCARCGAELPSGRVGTRRARYCRKITACLKRSQGRAETPAPPKLEDEIVLAKLPSTEASARQLQHVAAEFPEFTLEQVRRVLVRLVHRGRVRKAVQPVRRPQGGRAPLRYWRAA